MSFKYRIFRYFRFFDLSVRLPASLDHEETRAVVDFLERRGRIRSLLLDTREVKQAESEEVARLLNYLDKLRQKGTRVLVQGDLPALAEVQARSPEPVRRRGKSTKKFGVGRNHCLLAKTGG